MRQRKAKNTKWKKSKVNQLELILKMCAGSTKMERANLEKNARMNTQRFAKKFKLNGLERHNSNGCNAKCGLLHPNTCRSSLREKKRDWDNCRFYHLKGTKFTRAKNNTQPEEKSQDTVVI